MDEEHLSEAEGCIRQAEPTGGELSAELLQRQPGFSYFSIPNRLLELRPKMHPFTLDLWLLLHSRIQHN